MRIEGLDFKRTCRSTPEQYDVYDRAGNMVGYVRLRFGQLTCSYPDVGGEIICSISFDDEWMGEFNSKEERMYCLNIVACAIVNKIGAKEGHKNKEGIRERDKSEIRCKRRVQRGVQNKRKVHLHIL